MTPKELILKPGRDRSIQLRHPWIFQGAIASIKGSPGVGESVAVRSAEGAFLAWAAYSPKSQISARVWSFDEFRPLEAALVADLVRASVERREHTVLREFHPSHTNALRLIHGENDGLPGCIADEYAGWLVVQFLSAGAERWKHEITRALMEARGARGAFERSEGDAREKEGLLSSVGPLLGDHPPDEIEIFESFSTAAPEAAPLRALVSPAGGQKTGFYLDQRENRSIVHELADARDVLNAFSYTGAFSVAAWKGGATSVVSADASAPAVELARRNLFLNGSPTEGAIEADVFKLLREYRNAERKFDLIILDPPKFAATRTQVEKASRAYKDINWLAFRLLNPGGTLVTFSCSGSITPDLFQKIVFGAALDAGREAQILRRLTAAPDHPVRLTFPEGDYLKGLVCRAD